MGNRLAGLGKKERLKLASLIQAGLPYLTPKNVSENLNLTASQASDLLARWAINGWVCRMKQGVYILVPLQSENPNILAEEPWVLAQGLFSPCYIGGWTAAHHWGFTEQIFNSVMVITIKAVHEREVDLNGTQFHLKTTKESRIFGTKKIWIGNQKVTLSDPTKTIADAFHDPSVVGGIRMASDILINYMQSQDKDLSLLFDYSKSIGNSALFKRLGFIMESIFPTEVSFIENCKKSIKKGYSQLDPASPGKNLVTAWGLWITSSGRNKKYDHS